MPAAPPNTKTINSASITPMAPNAICNAPRTLTCVSMRRDSTRMPTADELTSQQRAQWSAAAAGWERWDGWFDRNSGNLAQWLCDAAGLKAGDTALDLACGAGQPSSTAA